MRYLSPLPRAPLLVAADYNGSGDGSPMRGTAG